jgi:hypothetical protein
LIDAVVAAGGGTFHAVTYDACDKKTLYSKTLETKKHKAHNAHNAHNAQGADTRRPNMYADDYGRSWHGPHPFTHTAVLTYAPSRVGVYQILYSSGSSDSSGSDGVDVQVVYIGIATGNNTIRARLSKHVTGSGNWALARLGDPTKFQFVYYPCDELTARQIESHVITMKKPPFNTRPEYRHFIPSVSVH